MYGQFVHDVATGRHTTDDKIRPLATGQVWTGQQALPLGLIDKVGGFRVALMDTAKDVGISGEPTIVRPAKTTKACSPPSPTTPTTSSPIPASSSTRPPASTSCGNSRHHAEILDRGNRGAYGVSLSRVGNIDL